MLLTRDLPLVLLLVVLLLAASAADAGRKRRPKRQHDRAAASRRERWRRRGREGVRHDAPVRHTEIENEGIPVGEAAAAPRCPPPVLHVSRDLCSASACLHHHQCAQGRACCFNGCIHTCLIQVDSPPVIDWLVDTSALLPILDESAPPELPVRYEDLSFAEGREEAVHLPGGCTISGTQYSQLQNFMKAPSIENCKCDQGEVVCAVKMFQS